jgi:hypothetical protein
MLDELAERYEDLTVITVSPYVGDDGETLRWVVLIDGEDVPDIDVRVRPDAERPEVMVMLLVYGGEELELERWSTKKYRYGTGVVRTLGYLRRRESEDSTGDSTA